MPPKGDQSSGSKVELEHGTQEHTVSNDKVRWMATIHKRKSFWAHRCEGARVSGGVTPRANKGFAG